jgi:hypothetical protein
MLYALCTTMFFSQELTKSVEFIVKCKPEQELKLFGWQIWERKGISFLKLEQRRLS